MMIYASWIDEDDIRRDPIELPFSQLTVVEIKELITRLQLPIKKSGRKAQLVESVLEYVRLFPMHVLYHLPACEIEMLKRLLAGETIYASCKVILELYVLSLLGWIVVREERYMKRVGRVILLDEAAALVRDLVRDFEPSRRCRIAQVVTGWSALCGLIPLGTVMEFLKKRPEFADITYYDMIDSVETYCDPTHICRIPEFSQYEGGLTYMTDWTRVVKQAAPLVISQQKTEGGRVVETVAYQPMQFSYKEILAASRMIFAPVTPNKSAIEALRAMGRKKKMNDCVVEEMILEIWKEKQQDGDNPIPSSIYAKLNCTDIKELNEWTKAFTDYSNSVPFWKFLGHSSEEESRREFKESTRPPRIVPGPNMRAMGMDVPAGIQEMVNQMWAESKEAWNSGGEQKVGRNDPCPCGSGKKYKKCCGRNG